MKQRFKLIPAVHLFLVKNDEILLLRRFNTGYEDGNYSVIAGHIDGNETATGAIIREAREEANIFIDPNNLEMDHVLHRKAEEERIDFFFIADKWEGEPKITETEKCDDLKWFPLNSLPKNTIPYVKFMIENYKSDNFYSEFGWDKK